MKKNEFIKRYKEERLNIGSYSLELDKLTDASFVMGCVFEDKIWKIFETTERTGHYIIKEFSDEDSAFDYFYELVLLQNKKN